MLPKMIKLINNTKAIFKIDSEPTKGSNNLVTSGGVYEALAAVNPVKTIQLDEFQKMDIEDSVIYLNSSMPELNSCSPYPLRYIVVLDGINSGRPNSETFILDAVFEDIWFFNSLGESSSRIRIEKEEGGKFYNWYFDINGQDTENTGGGLRESR